MIKKIVFLVILAGSMFFQAAVLRAAPLEYDRDVKLIFQKHCFSCHGRKKQEAGLRLDLKSSAFKGGESYGPSIISGNAKESPLIQFVKGDDEDTRMPPEGKLLSAAEVLILTKWINAGAKWSDDGDTGKQKDTLDHWSFQPMKQAALPKTNDQKWAKNAIDHFILARLEKEKFQPSPDTDRVTWLRRVYFTLTGLPPSLEQVKSFVQDKNENAYERVVDDLLKSPRYGERWAQHWLDVIRWSETVGFETNLPRPNAWHYRDWVIAAFNADKPYNEFLLAQLAGDTREEDAALGFLVAGPANLPGQIGRDVEAMRQARQDEMDEVIRTVGQSLFGLTIGCARCHSHKFDPITQGDYYSMQAVFAGLSYGDRRLRGTQNDTWTAQIPAVDKRLDKLRQERSALKEKYQLRDPLELVQTETFPAIQVKSVRMRIDGTNNRGAASLYEFEVWSESKNGKPASNVALASGGAKPSASSFLLANQSRHFDNLVDGSIDRRQAFPWVSAKGGPAWFRIDLAKPSTINRIVWHNGSSVPVDYEIEVLPEGSDVWKRVADTHDRFPRIDDMRAAKDVKLTGLTPKQVSEIFAITGALRKTESERGRLVRGPQVYAASFSKEPETTWLLGRGDPMKRVRQVAPSAPVFLGGSKLAIDAPEVERRLALAKHLTREDHPLTARVIVNRVWQHHFGAGIVDTPSDFGEMGAAPSHPLLLDWLAVDFVKNGWSLKRLHRQIVLSRTFQQSSKVRREPLLVDAESRLLWRFPPRRLEAEAIRDSVLSVSGKLNLKMGGAGFDFFNQRGGLSDYKAKETFDESGWRRMIYAHKIRMQSVDIFGAFDCPDAGQMKPKRTRSITPIQSLSLLNSPFINRQATFFAERVRSEVGADPGAQVTRSFKLIYSRVPRTNELQHLTTLASQHGLEQVCRVLFNTKEFMYIQ